jgi:broad specificity phosphatase PhoE
MTRPLVYFVRHGETDWNRERRLQGQHDIPLNALGRVQATRCGELLRGLVERNGRAFADYDFVASPLGRARETMELIRATVGLEVAKYRTDARLMEMSFGRWEGFTFSELQAREATLLVERERDRWGFVIPGGESYALLQARVGAWYDGLERDSIVAAHGGVCRVLMAHLSLLERNDAVRGGGDIGQGCVYVFDGNSVARHD